MGAIFGVTALYGFFLALVAGCVLFALGLYVVKRYPANYDPARNAKRYVYPATVLVILATLGALAVVVGLIGAGISILVTA
jgi:uncharacterized iron-regulated membrane protein